MIDPSLWTDEGMIALTVRQQMLYIGLFSNADDEGRLRGSPKAIRMMLPTVYARLKDEVIEVDLLAVLKEMRQLTRYEVDERQYLEFQNYAKWQKIDHPSKSSLPSKDGFDEPSPNAQGGVAPKLIRLDQLGKENLDQEKPPPVVARKTRARRTYQPVDDEFLEQMRTRFEPTFGTDVYAGKVRKCLKWADDKGYKDRRTYLEDWLASDAQKLTSERANGHAIVDLDPYTAAANQVMENLNRELNERKINAPT